METEPATPFPLPPPCPEPSPLTERPVRLGWMQLVLRLAAGQSVEHVAALFRRAVDEVRRRAEAVPVHCLVDGLRTLTILPGEARIARLAARASRYLVSALDCGRPGAERFVEIFRRRGQDPALVLADLCQRQLARVERMPEGLGRPRTPRPPKPRPLVVLRSGDLPPLFEGPAMRFAYAMRDELIVADARILQGQCEELRNAPPETEEALRRHILRIGKPYRSEPAADERRHEPGAPLPRHVSERPLRQWAQTIGRVFQPEPDFAFYKPVPKPPRSSGVYQAETEFDPFGRDPPDPGRADLQGVIIAPHDFNPLGPAPPDGRYQALTEWDVFKPVPKPPPGSGVYQAITDFNPH